MNHYLRAITLSIATGTLIIHELTAPLQTEVHLKDIRRVAEVFMLDHNHTDLPELPPLERKMVAVSNTSSIAATTVSVL